MQYALELVKNFTREAVRAAKAHGAERAYGLELLWDMIQDDTTASDGMAARAVDALASMLPATDDAEVVKMIQRAMESVKDGKSVPQCVDLVRQIIDALPLYNQGALAQSGALQQLHKDYNVFKTTTTALEAYLKQVCAADSPSLWVAVLLFVFDWLPR